MRLLVLDGKAINAEKIIYIKPGDGGWASAIHVGHRVVIDSMYTPEQIYEMIDEENALARPLLDAMETLSAYEATLSRYREEMSRLKDLLTLAEAELSALRE